MGPPSLVNFDIFLLHGVAASLRALPMSQSSVPPPSVAPGPDFYFDLYEETEVCQFAIHSVTHRKVIFSFEVGGDFLE
jgi:hypothetical protein